MARVLGNISGGRVLGTLGEDKKERVLGVAKEPTKITYADFVMAFNPLPTVTAGSRELRKQFAIGATNEALLGVPLFLLEKAKGEEAREALISETKAGRFARGLGSAAGFTVGLPAKVFKKGGQLGLRGLAKVAPKAGRFKKAAAAGAGAFGLYETVKAPEKDFTEKFTSIPASLAFGAGLGIGAEALKPVVSKAISKFVARKKDVVPADIPQVTKQVVDQATIKVQQTRGRISNLIQANKLPQAQDIINNELSGIEQLAAQSELNVMKIKGLGSAKKRVNNLIKQGLFDDAQNVVDIELKGAESFIEQSKINVARNRPINPIDAIKAGVEGIIPEEQIPAKVINESKRINLKHILDNNVTTSAESVLRGQPTPAGGQLVDALFDVEQAAGIRKGGARVDFLKVVKGFTKSELDNLREVIRGRAIPLNNRVQNAVGSVKNRFDNMLNEGISMNMTVKSYKTSLGEKVPIVKLLKDSTQSNYFPQMQIPINAPREKVIETARAAVKEGLFKNEGTALDFWDGYTKFIRSGEKTNNILDFVIKGSRGKITTREQASNVLQTFAKFSKQRRFGNLERARDIDFPFWDRDPLTAIPRYFDGAYTRLEEVKRLGLNDEMVNVLVDKIRAGGGDSGIARNVFNQWAGLESEFGRRAFKSISPELSNKIRGLQVVTKLGTAVIANSSQSNNTAIKFGIRNTAKQIANYLKSPVTRAQQTELAERSGAVLDSTMEQLFQRIGGGQAFRVGGKKFGVNIDPRKFLEFTGFGPIERFNRVIAANAGAEYGKVMTDKLLKNPADKLARRALAEMRVNPQTIIDRGTITFDETLTIAQNASRATQFKPGVLDLPLWWSSPEGKIVTQFKSFAFSQARFIKRAVFEEMARGNFTPFIRAIALMPIIGEGVNDVKALLTGKSRDKRGLDRLAENFFAVAAFGLFSDLYQSLTFRGGGERFALGPTISDIVSTGSGVKELISGKPRTLGKFVSRQVPVIGPLLSRKAFPPKTKKTGGLRTLRKLRKL